MSARVIELKKLYEQANAQPDIARRFEQLQNLHDRLVSISSADNRDDLFRQVCGEDSAGIGSKLKSQAAFAFERHLDLADEAGGADAALEHVLAAQKIAQKYTIPGHKPEELSLVIANMAMNKPAPI